MSFTLEIDHLHQIIRYQHQGSLQVEDIGCAWEELVQLEEFTKKGYNLLSDYRDASFDFAMDNIDIIVNILEQMPFLREKKQAIIINDPYSTAGSLVFEEQVYQETGFIVKTFTTAKAAFEWVRIEPGASK